MNNEQKIDTKMSMKMIAEKIPGFLIWLFTLLIVAGSGVATGVNAQGTAAKDSLVVKQYSIDSGDFEIRESLGGQEGRLTFQIFAGFTTGLDAEQILSWMEDGTIELSGIRFDLNRAVIVNEKRLSVPFKYDRPLQYEFLETELRIAGSDWIEDTATPVSLYRGAHGVMNINLIGEGKRLAGELVSSQSVVAQRFSFENPDLFPRYGYQPVFSLWNGEHSDKKHGGFFHRNRYWVMGAATIVASSTTALLMSGGDSVTYLPEPPGRP